MNMVSEMENVSNFYHLCNLNITNSTLFEILLNCIKLN